jgi:hypothetical protein
LRANLARILFQPFFLRRVSSACLDLHFPERETKLTEKHFRPLY